MRGLILKIWGTKTRSPDAKRRLGQTHSTIYENVYSDVCSSGLVGFFTKILHKDMESPFKPSQLFNVVLEIGSGDGVHRPFVRHRYNEYWQSDIRYEKSVGDNTFASKDGKVYKIYLDAQELSKFKDSQFDRIIAICVLLHLSDIESALIQWRRVVKDGGMITIYTPSEPGLLLSLAQYLTTKRKFEKHGIDYYSWQYQEHISYFPIARVIINKVFINGERSMKKWPISFLPWHFSLWSVYQININKPESDLYAQ